MAILSAFPGKSKPKLQEKTVTPSTLKQTVTPSSNYEGLSKVTVNAMPTATQATPSITVSSAGLVTASATQSAGYVASGTKSSTKQLTTQAGTTITPGTSQKTAVATGRYTTGNVYVAGDSNLVSSNIKSGVSIFGVSGGLKGYELEFITVDTSTSLDTGYDGLSITANNSNLFMKYRTSPTYLYAFQTALQDSGGIVFLEGATQSSDNAFIISKLIGYDEDMDISSAGYGSANMPKGSLYDTSFRIESVSNMAYKTFSGRYMLTLLYAIS